MPRAKNVTPMTVRELATRANVVMNREKAFSTLLFIKDIRRELRDARNFMKKAVDVGDAETYSIALKCAHASRDQWFRLVGYPLPSKLIKGERPLDNLIETGQARYTLEAAMVNEAQETQAEVDLVPA